HTRSKRDWSSDVCSSDLARPAEGVTGGPRHLPTCPPPHLPTTARVPLGLSIPVFTTIRAPPRGPCRHQSPVRRLLPQDALVGVQIGRASCRERVAIAAIA